MSPLDTLLQAAAQHHAAGRHQQAEKLYREILAQDPAHVETLNHYGVLAVQLGRGEAALLLLERARSLAPAHGGILANLGSVLQESGRYAEAVVAYQRAAEVEPANASHLYNLGNVLRRLQEHDKAAHCYRGALDLDSGHQNARNNLALSLQQLGETEAAIAHLQEILHTAPHRAEIWCNLGNALAAAGRASEAREVYDRAIQLRPTYAEAYYNLATVLPKLGLLDETIAAYRSAIRLQPERAAAHYNLAVKLTERGRLLEAFTSYHEALRLDPALADAYNNLGNLYKDFGRIEHAVECFRHSVARAPESASLQSNLVYGLSFHPDMDRAALLAEAVAWDQKHGHPVNRVTRSRNRSHRRIRIGYVSVHFWDHVIGRNLLPLLREHDRRRFEIYCYSCCSITDAFGEGLRTVAEHWREIGAMADTPAAELIQADEMDLLVDLDLHLAHNRLPLFALHPAPVQATFAGYPGGTGLAAIDWRLTDHHLDPPGVTDADYRERSWRLKSFWCYDFAAMTHGQPSIVEPGSLPMLRNGFVTFGCLSNFGKINGAVLRCWANLLNTTPDSRLRLLAPTEDARQEIVHLLRENGIDPARVDFTTHRARADYLAEYRQIDLGLDPFPYNGHTTTLDSLWMGVPVVTFAGKTVVGRAGVSQLTNLGLPELIGRNVDEYLQIAGRLAVDPERLAQLRSTLRERMLGSVLMDAPGFTRDIEAAYSAMLDRAEL